VARIGHGYLLLVAVGREEREEDVRRLADKVLHLRLFEDAEGKMNLALSDVRGAALVVPQFTLYADWRRGRRPSWAGAAPPEVAAELVDAFARTLASLGIPVRTGAFGRHMEVELVNDGPVTLLLDSADL